MLTMHANQGDPGYQSQHQDRNVRVPICLPAHAASARLKAAYGAETESEDRHEQYGNSAIAAGLLYDQEALRVQQLSGKPRSGLLIELSHLLVEARPIVSFRNIPEQTGALAEPLKSKRERPA
jgi:hypothetical protein